MPLTAQVLELVVETREQYGVRRVWWAVDFFHLNAIHPRKWELILKANVYSIRNTPSVKCAIESAMQINESELPYKQKQKQFHNIAEVLY